MITTSQENSLLIRMPNWIGDCMMALPTLHYLEKKGFGLTLIGKPWLNDLFAEAWPVIPLQNNEKLLAEAIKPHQAEHMLLLTNSYSSARVARKAKKKAIGYKGHYRKLLLHKKFSQYANLHEANHFLKLAQLYLADVLNADPLKVFCLPKKSAHAITSNQEKLQNQYDFLNKPFILICPFAAGTNKAGESKVWPYWHTLVEKLEQKFPNFNIVYCPKDQETLDMAMDNLFCLDNITLSEYLAVMSIASMVIGNDTGPMHMAAAVNPTSLTIFGATDPNRTAPLDGHVIGTHGKWPELGEVVTALTGFRE